jgi:hypothetical protein
VPQHGNFKHLNEQEEAAEETISAAADTARP